MKIEVERLLGYLENNPAPLPPTKPVDQKTLISAGQQLRITGVLCQCLSLMVGETQSSLMWLSAPQSSLSVCEPTRDELERDTRGAQCSPPESPCSAQASYQSSGNAVLQAKSTWLASERKYLRSARWSGCHWHGITGSHFQNKTLGGGEGVWMLRMCIRRVYTQVASVSPLLTRTYQTDMKAASTLSTEVRFQFLNER